jgi:class 3 adenylate cyclase
MYEFELDEVEKEFGAEAGLELKFKGLAFVEPIMKACNATKLEDVLWFFESPKDALDAALRIRRELRIYNQSHRGLGNQIDITGFGMHLGEILYYAGTDVHWGDPVNTSSKLGQDTAKHGQILIT